MKKKYTIKPVDNGYQVVREDGSIVNEATFDKLWKAEIKLKTLIAFGYCK